MDEILRTSKIERLLGISKELLDFADNKLKPKIIKSGDTFEDVSLFLFAKSTKTFRAIFILCGEGYGEDAAILGRSLLENLINLTYINKEENEHRAELFISYSLLDNKRKINFIKDEPEFKGIDIAKKFDSKFGQASGAIEEIYNEERKKIKSIGKYKISKHNWSCLSIKDMATETGLGELYYNMVYWIISRFSHPHAGSSDGYFYKNGDGTAITINDLPSETWIEQSLVLAFDCYFKMINLINEILKFDLGEQIKILEQRYIEMMKK